MGIIDWLCELLAIAPLTFSLVCSPPLPCVNSTYIVYTYTVCKGGEYGVIGKGGLRQIEHLPQSPFTDQFFKITTFGIAFYQSNLSTIIPIKASPALTNLM